MTVDCLRHHRTTLVLHTVVLLARASQVYKALNTCNSDRTNTYQMSGMYSSLCFCSPTCISEQGLTRFVLFQSYASKNICHRDCIRLGKGRIHIQNSLVHISCELETSCMKTLYTYKYMIFTRDAYDLPCFQALYTIRRRWSLVHSILCLMSKIDM